MVAVSPADPVEGTPEHLSVLAREVEEFVSHAGWDQPPQLFALVPTADLVRMQPELAESVDVNAELTPIAQEPLPDGDLGEALSRIMWPETVRGCALVQEIVVLPPDAEDDLPGEDDPDLRIRAAAEHPRHREARLVAAVLRESGRVCLMRLRGTGPDPDELIEGPDLAPNLVDALRATFR